MTRRIIIIGLLLALCVLLPLSGVAEGGIPQERQLPRLVDEADLLTAGEEESLLSLLDEISERQQCDVVVVTVDSLEGKSSTAYADDFYDYNGYGMGPGDDGVLLLISMEYRDWAITTYGFGITALTEAGLDYIEEQFLPKLSAGDYYAALERFASVCDRFLAQAREGTAYDRDHMPLEPLDSIWILISLVIGAVLALIITGVMRGQLKSVRSQPLASDYVKPGSFALTEQRDLFLYRTVVRHARPKESSSGGSRTHTSSSGRSHGGSHGKF